jgi:hypothetical protein
VVEITISNLEHSHRIRTVAGEPRSGSHEPVRGTFTNRFVRIRLEFFENQVPSEPRQKRLEKKKKIELINKESRKATSALES